MTVFSGSDQHIAGLEAKLSMYREQVDMALAQRTELLAMLKTVTAELEAEVNDTYRGHTTGCNGDMHPAYVRRYNRDMQPVRDAQALIAAIEGAEVTP
jgi:hypothetical protein